MNSKVDVSDEITEAKIQRGWDDMAAGRTRPAHMIFDEIRERHVSDKVSSRYNYAGRV